MPLESSIKTETISHGEDFKKDLEKKTKDTDFTTS